MRRTAIGITVPLHAVRPWLHCAGMAYQEAGIAAHNAEPDQRES
jgi:hypothetical protein